MPAATSKIRVVDAIAKWLGVIGAIVGGLIALSTYRDQVNKQVDERGQSAFALAEEFGSSEYMTLRNKISAQGSEPSVDYLERPLTPDVATRQQVHEFVGFFDRVQICVEAGMCDKRTTQRLFQPYAVGFWAGLQRHIQIVRLAEAKDQPQHSFQCGYGLEKLANADRRPRQTQFGS
jgi:hypothetical protein